MLWTLVLLWDVGMMMVIQGEVVLMELTAAVMLAELAEVHPSCPVVLCKQ